MKSILITGTNMDVKISTITLSTKLHDCQLNLTNIGKYLDIDDDIIGIKYNYAGLSIMKGKYSTTIYKKAKTKDMNKINQKLFYNQISIIVNNNGNNVNVKLFGNGSLHLTGCKAICEGRIVTRKIYDKLKTLIDKKDIILLAKDINGVLLDKDKLVYSYSSNQIIGYCKDTNMKGYVINNKDYIIDKKTNQFITEKMETQRRHFISNFDGECIGYTKIELMKNRHKFYKRNNNIYFDTDNGLIYYNNESIIGKVAYYINKENITDTLQSNDIMEVDYDCNPFMNKKQEIFETLDNDQIDLNVNCMNVYFNINYAINRQRFYDRLISMNFICKYKPESYSGIKIVYKIPLYKTICKSSGICPCTNKCTCINITFLVFQSGNVIATGFKNLEQVDEITQEFYKICELVKKDIKRRLFIQ
jgi:TATA-box binding protein (TBP) (component of TFIID and TFIIIB)